MWLRKFILGVGFSKALGRNDPIGRIFNEGDCINFPLLLLKNCPEISGLK